MGAYNQAVAPGITRPLHCTDSEAAVANHYIESSGVTATTPLELVCASTVYPLLAENANSATLAATSAASLIPKYWASFFASA